MGRNDHPQSLTLERFAAGKDGRANAFKKKKQANKRKLFEKAQLKRQYAKVLKKEAQAAGAPDNNPRSCHHNEPSQCEGRARVGHDGETELHQQSATAPTSQTMVGEHATATEEQNGCLNGSITGKRQVRAAGKSKGGEKRISESESRDKGKRRRQGHRPDPFHDAKAKANRKRREAEEKQNERDRQRQEKEERVNKRRRHHALLSKRTRGGQPVMMHTMRHLLEKIQAQS